jgi:hypothetical protein
LKVKLVVVQRSAPDDRFGIFPSRDAALPEFKELARKDDTLRATIDPIEGERTEANSAFFTVGQGVDADLCGSTGAAGGYADVRFLM